MAVTPLRRDAEISVREIDGELLVLDLRTQRVHQLNRSASFIWQRCAEGLAPQEIAVALVDAFELDREVALRDVYKTLTMLRSLELLETGTTSG